MRRENVVVSAIAVTHSAAEGTLVFGTARGDGSREVLAPAGFRWYRSMGAWGIVGSRDRVADVERIERAASGLRAAGFTVSVALDDAPRAATTQSARPRRGSVRVPAQTDQRTVPAGRDAPDRVSPPDEPSKGGHHREGSPRRSIPRAQTVVARSVAAAAKAENDRRKAEAAVAGEAHRRSPTAVKNRIDRLEADQRRDERARDGTRRVVSRITGAAYIADSGPAVGGEARRRLVARIARRQDDIDYWKGVYAAQVDAGIAQRFTSSTITKGDEVRYRGRWYVVTRVNPKSVTVRMARGTGNIRYHECVEHRSGAAAPRAAAEPKQIPR